MSDETAAGFVGLGDKAAIFEVGEGIETTQWDGNTYCVSFGDGPHRNWDDAREYDFVAAGGGAWYSKTLKQLEPGNHVFVYISKGNGVGGYVGLGEVTGRAVLAKDFVVEREGKATPITEIAPLLGLAERTRLAGGRGPVARYRFSTRSSAHSGCAGTIAAASLRQRRCSSLARPELARVTGRACARPIVLLVV